MLKAGKTKPTNGTKIAGKKVAVIFLFYKMYRVNQKKSRKTPHNMILY